MAHGKWMRRYARWHIWLGWLVGVPLLLWTFSGVAMVLRPIEEVRGNDLRLEQPPQVMTRNAMPIAFQPNGLPGAIELRSFIQRGRAVTLVTASDGNVRRFDAATGRPIPPVGEQEARAAVAAAVRGGSQIESLTLFSAEDVPLDFRKPVAAWRAVLVNGANVYVNRDTGEVDAVRTRWWRFYDIMWGIHIMDLQTREDAHNPFTIGFGILAFIGGLFGVVLLFRRRKARAAAVTAAVSGPGR